MGFSVHLSASHNNICSLLVGKQWLSVFFSENSIIITICVWFKTLYSLTLPSSLEKKVRKSSVWNSSLTAHSGIKSLNYNLRYKDVSHPHPSSACGLTLPPPFNTILHSYKKKIWITNCVGVSPSNLAQEVCWVFKPFLKWAAPKL